MAGEGAASWWPAGRLLSPGCLQAIWTVHIGGQTFVLLNVRWFEDCRVDEAWGRLERVRVRGSSAFEQQAGLVEATCVDAQFWLTDIPREPNYKHAHYRMRAGYSLPEHLVEGLEDAEEE